MRRNGLTPSDYFLVGMIVGAMLILLISSLYVAGAKHSFRTFLEKLPVKEKEG